MEAPLREIVANCGEEPSVVLNAVKDGKGNYGYNAATGEYGDMIEFGILDPTKVTRSALQNAASIAGLMITTEAMVAELPKKDEPAMQGGGGMGDMGGMGFCSYGIVSSNKRTARFGGPFSCVLLSVRFCPGSEERGEGKG